MSNLIRCPQCEIPYLPGEAVFCPNCGAKLPGVTDVKKQLSRIENAPRPYSALRFISALVIAGGWMVIIISWAVTVLYYSIGAGFLFVSSTGDVPVLPVFIPLVFLFISTLIGIVVIGAGQLYAVILDIRDDMHSTMQFVRYGLKRSEEK